LERITMKSHSSFRRLALPMTGLLALCAFVHACGGGGGGGGGNPPAPAPPPGPTSFVSTSQFPTNSSVNVPRQPIIILGFNDIVNPVTMTSTSVSLSLGPTPVACNRTYNACNNRIEMTPVAALDPGAVYTVSLTSELLDDDNEALTASTFSFTTTGNADTDRPAFTQAGFDGVPNPGTETTEILLSWDDGVDGLNPPGTISYRVYMSTQPVCFDFSAPIVSVGAGQLSAIVPGLFARTTYSFVVRAVDAAGNESLNNTPINVMTYTSFLTNVYPIVQQSCATCHNPPNGQAWLNNPAVTMDYTSPQNVFNSWVNQTSSLPGAAQNGFGIRVVPGDPLTSFLYHKINDATPVAGLQMPWGQPALPAATQAVIFDWITEGALDN
jgi:hypothetical protein